MFSKFFNKTPPDDDIINFKRLNPIFSYFTENNSTTLKNVHLSDLDCYAWAVQDDFKSEEWIEALNQAGFKSAIDMFNACLVKLNVAPITGDNINNPYIFYEIEFNVDDVDEFYNFYFFYCANDEYRLTYVLNCNKNPIETISESTFFNPKNPKNEQEKTALKYLKEAVVSLETHIKTQDYLETNFPKDSPEAIAELLRLVTRNKVDSQAALEFARQLFASNCLSNVRVDNALDFLTNNNQNADLAAMWDYKFDAEEIKFLVEGLANQTLDFDFPESTFGSDLFPYVQTALDKHALALYTFFTYADHYGFLVIHQSDIQKIRYLSQLTKIEIKAPDEEEDFDYEDDI